MQLSMLGLNHNTATLSVREKMAVADDDLPKMYEMILADSRVQEAVIFSTCNRVEYYVVAKEKFNNHDLLYLVATICGIGANELRKHSYINIGSDAIKHVVMVASGIDSLVLGEPQIFGQVKDAFKKARVHGALKSYMNRLEQFVSNTTKRVRTDTGIAENAVSVSYAAVDLAKKIFDTLVGRKALIIGAGEMCELAMEHLDGAGIGHMTITNRTFERAEALARRFKGRAVEFSQIETVLEDVDIIISSTGATEAIVNKEMVQKAMKKRKGNPMFFIDIAVPRDIDMSVAKLSNVYVYDMDDLKQVVENNRKEREGEAEKAKELITGSVVRFERVIESLAADPIIQKIRSKAQCICEDEIEKFKSKHVGIGDAELKGISYILEASMNKLLHPSSVNLKSLIVDNKEYSITEAANILFGIKKDKIN